MNDTTTQFPYNPDHPIGTCSDCGEEMVFNVPRLGQAGGYIHKSGKQCQRSVVKDSFTTADTTTNDKCPHCGAGIGLQYTGKINPVEIRIATCGTWLLPVSDRTELCEEREARQKLEARIDRINNDNFNLANMLSKAEAEVARLEERLEKEVAAFAAESINDQHRAIKSEANLRRAVEIAGILSYWPEMDVKMKLITELDAIKEQINL